MNKNMYEILFEIRKNSNLSRKKLSDLSGFKEPTIVGYEKGLRKPSDEYIRFISLYFNASEDFIRGISKDNKAYTPLKRTLLMYQDIYGYDNLAMAKILDRAFPMIERYRQILEIDITNIKKRSIPLLIEVTESFNIKPSSIGLVCLNIEDEMLRYDETQREWSKERMSMMNECILIMEEKGVKFDTEYYAQNIKKRNLAKSTYTPEKEVKELPQKYQDIVDLLPYASDQFLNDIYKKLKTIKELQTL
jgi:transcriptional regulator with XRE-family HTH domain